MLALMAAAVSFDGFGLGIASRARGLRLGHAAAGLLSLASTVAASLGLAAGWGARAALPPGAVQPASASLLLLLALWIIAQSWLQFVDERLAIVFGRPERVDQDGSGVIEAREAFPLALTLGIDAAILGLAAGLRGTSPVLALLVGSGKLFALSLGASLGSRHRGTPWVEKMAVIPATVLIILAFWD